MWEILILISFNLIFLWIKYYLFIEKIYAFFILKQICYKIKPNPSQISSETNISTKSAQPASHASAPHVRLAAPHVANIGWASSRQSVACQAGKVAARACHNFCIANSDSSNTKISRQIQQLLFLIKGKKGWTCGDAWEALFLLLLICF
jgi:hypothetical protein